MVGYYRQFFSHFGELAGLLVRFIIKDTLFFWGENKKNLVPRPNQCLGHLPTLVYPDFDKDFILFTMPVRLQ